MGKDGELAKVYAARGVDIGTNIHICQTLQHRPDALTLQCGLVKSEREGGSISPLQIS